MPRLFSSEGVRLRNRAAILKTIRERGAISRSEIARTLRLSPSTVSRPVRAPGGVDGVPSRWNSIPLQGTSLVWTWVVPIW